MLTTRRHEYRKLQKIVRDFERLADLEEKDNARLAEALSIHLANQKVGGNRRGRQILAAFKGDK